MSGVEELTPTEELLLEVLAARYRCGETAWTFSRRMRPIAVRLESRGLVNWKSGIVENTILVWLTDEGQETVLSDTYVPPVLLKFAHPCDDTCECQVKARYRRGSVGSLHSDLLGNG